jgi:undecaprenyl diphosphate synthase
MDYKEIKIEVYGRVQGVTFRHFTKEHADKLGLKGFVKNRDDGSVLIIAQGSKKDLEKLLEQVQKGPKWAKVDGVSYFWKNSKNEYENFVIALDKGFIGDQKSSFWNLGKKIFNIKQKIPRHVAIIPDGNRRWAKKNGMKAVAGHKKSASYDTVFGLFDEARKLGIKYMTIWGFSTENWSRSSLELKALFDVIYDVLVKFEKEAGKNEIRFRHLGRRDRLPKKLVEQIVKLEKATEKYDKFFVQLCLDYGGRDETSRAINKILKSGVQEIEENDIVRYLDSAGIPDPDLIIRTSGEKRMSGFMSFQSAYSEFYFADVNFPDFGPKELQKAVEKFTKRRRSYGK